jgi:2-polyprenyl-3-methyl-5-hydroxy-6-metoxy-1,4-benzoquinol methylase
MKIDPNTYYMKEDPFKIKDSEEEWNKAYIINSLITGREILDIGCGEGFFTEMYAKNSSYTAGADISSIAIGRARAKTQMRNALYLIGDITKQSFRLVEEGFSTVIISEVLYYIDPKLLKVTIDNIYKSMKPDGQLIISVGQYFTESDIREIFKEINFNKVYKLPNKKYGYWLIMSGHRV